MASARPMAAGHGGRAVTEQASGLTLLGSAEEVLERCDPVFLWMARDDAAGVLAATRDALARRQPLVVTCTPGVPVAEYTAQWADTPQREPLHGLYDREACAAMVRQTIAETLALEAQDGIGTGEVIRRVAHPGGSTEKGLAVLDRLFVHLSG